MKRTKRALALLCLALALTLLMGTAYAASPLLRRGSRGADVKQLQGNPIYLGYLNDVADGIRVTANLLKQRKIVICEGCESCLSEIAAYCWEESGTGRDRPKKERDHAMDEMRYFAVSIAKKERGGGIAMRAVERAAR